MERGQSSAREDKKEFLVSWQGNQVIQTCRAAASSRDDGRMAAKDRAVVGR